MVRRAACGYVAWCLVVSMYQYHVAIPTDVSSTRRSRAAGLQRMTSALLRLKGYDHDYGLKILLVNGDKESPPRLTG